MVVVWFQANIKKLERDNVWSKAHLEDQAEKLQYARDDFIPRLVEENQVLLGSLSSLESTDEAQLIADQEEDNRYDALEKELVALRAKTAEAQARTKAELEKVENKKAAVAQVAESAKLGFDRCKSLIVVAHPELPLKYLDFDHGVFEGKLVKPRSGVPLEEAEVVFDPSPTSEEEDSAETDSFTESETLSDA